MAATAITIQDISSGDADLTYEAANVDGNYFAYPTDGSKCLFLMKNADATPHTATIDSQVNCSFGSDHNLTMAVAAADDGAIMIYPRQRFVDSSGNVQITYDAVTSVTVAVAKLKG